MSKIITFSRQFPKSHPKAGQPTHFVEQIYNSIYTQEKGDWSDAFGTISEYVIELNHFVKGIKNHTIRAGNRWKVGDKFSPRVWSGKPYQSQQITIAPDTKIEKIFDICIYQTYEVIINGKFFCTIGSENWHKLSENDGLSPEDMRDWFSKLPFQGQVICWSKDVEY